MKLGFFERHQFVKDVIGFTVFVSCVMIGTFFINTFVFRSFNVIGPSMESTLYTGDRLVVNRLPVTWSQLKNESYIPERGQIIVFKNPHFSIGISGNGENNEYIVKRVIAFPGETVELKDGKYTVFNSEYPKGFNPDDNNNGEPGSYTTGSGSWVVPNGELFVSGDHRQGNYSYDSRNGLGTIPLYNLIGPVVLRIFPFDNIRTF